MSRPSSWVLVLCAVALVVAAGGCASSSSAPPLSVSLSPSVPQTIDQGQTVGINASVVNDSTLRGVAWSLMGSGSLSNPTGTSVTYNPPTSSITTGQQTIIKATSLADPTKSASLAITVNPLPQFTLFWTYANGTVGVAYNQTIGLTGGTPPFQWSVYNGPIITGYKVGGAVPDGLTLNPSTGTISGTPTAGGTWYFELTATDATGDFAFYPFSIQINPSGAAGNPVPFLNQSLAPAAAAPGRAGFTLSVSGTGFVSGAAVDWDGALLTTSFVDSEHLTAVVPPANIGGARTATVSVVNPRSGGGRSNTEYLQIGAPEAAVHFVNAAGSPLQVYGPLGLVSADFNEDGKPDLVVAGAVEVYVMLGNGDGTFAPAGGSPMRIASPPYDDFASPYLGPLTIGDFNHSGHLGLAVGMPQNDAAAILLGNGDGTFSPSSAVFASAGDPTTVGISAADFNGDGNLDLVLANSIYESAPVELGYGVGAFTTASTLYASGFASCVALGDFNGDGKLDTVVGAGGYDSSGLPPGLGLMVWLGVGDGTFTVASGSPFPPSTSLSAIVSADFNGDGKLDLAATDGVGNAIVLLGNGDGTFGPPSTIPVGKDPDAIVSGDFNNDGRLDLAIANFTDNTITLLLGNGDGTFTEAPGSPYPTGQGPYQITAADFNGDGKLDLAVANLTDGTVSILLQQ